MASQLVLVAKNPPASAGDVRNMGSIPGSGRSPEGGYGNLVQYSCLENPMDRGAWWAAVHRIASSWTLLKWLSMHTYVHIYRHILFCILSHYGLSKDTEYKSKILFETHLFSYYIINIFSCQEYSFITWFYWHFFVLKFVSSTVFRFSFIKTDILVHFLAAVKLRGKRRGSSYSPCPQCAQPCPSPTSLLVLYIQREWATV